ncbi:MAG: BMP family ABC transporter substrate-binding protein [Alphaproteobacteria bacterium]|nr:BMP family ABC transporter substrate-binding protein [Alphaproteobacteria bacterium]MBU1573160.1 BMP family ABC transporter substrate-binding protein [Alphaproteobacteria bacterium]MBU2078220.1 BMP family ABC transporter substrate-binding protein [Alphaproteobacteria bacterium]MBU2160450.1 BMP family ABC transporter substrate-binding protein [Alphaproteobacteria bacterium]MBU2242011.1 BMP family ABC transporter substrate-binding protein [Alphaproteobacteria bacterium]
MTLTKTLLGAVAALALTSGAALADPAIIFDLGGKFDKSFNEAAFNGAERWAKETGGTYRDVELQSDAQREQYLRNFAEKGFNPIVMAGFSFATALETVAADFPDTKFAIIDMVVDAPNVRSVVFNEQEGSYLAGIAAAYAAKGDTVSFVGGMDIPLISKFACGYAEGFKSVKPEGKVIVNMTGTTPAAWNDPVKGGELTRAQKSAGSEVVFAAAGGTGLGVLQTAADEGMLSIGVDSNQNYLQPGSVLTSMVKRVDNAVYDAFTQGENLETGINVMGLSNDGVGVAMDEYNAALITPEMKAAIDDATAKIIAGEIVVHDYMSDESCPAF